MKNLFLSLAFIFTVPFALFAQDSPPAPPGVYNFGNRIIRVPAPDGFTDITSKFPKVAGRMRATEGASNEFLAVHAPETLIPKLQSSKDIDLEFYTKVSTNKNGREMEITPQIFAAAVADLEKNFGTYIEPDGPLMKGVEKNAGKGLTELLGSETRVKVSGTKNLGFFEKSDKAFSGMILINVELYGRQITSLATFSLLHINQRAVVVSAYRKSPDGNSIRELTDFTKKWTAKILAANK